jgi:isopenicillin N synthase-like dioxygenase
MTTLSLPIVDMAELDKGPAGRARLVGALKRAATANGFFYLVNHGIPVALLAEMMEQARRFFRLDIGSKLAISAVRPSGLGYGIMGNLTDRGEPGANAKEEFYYARDDVPGLKEQNRWPAELPGFRDTLVTYIDGMHELAAQTMSLLAESMDLSPNHFDEFCVEPVATTRLVKYPIEGAQAGAHTDFGALTFLLQDSSGGLQVFDKSSNQWVDATPVPGSFVVNLGDLFEVWTNRTYRSSLHRVVHTAAQDRFSIPFFLNGSAGYVVQCLPQFLRPGEAPSLAPTTPTKRLDEGYVEQGLRARRPNEP